MHTGAHTTHTHTLTFTLLTDPATNISIYKIFANAAIDEDTLRHKIFLNVTETHTQYWPFTFLDLTPPPAASISAGSSSGAGYQPLTLFPRVLYLSPIESVASAMECSVIAGRNAAMLLAASASASAPNSAAAAASPSSPTASTTSTTDPNALIN